MQQQQQLGWGRGQYRIPDQQEQCAGRGLPAQTRREERGRRAGDQRPDPERRGQTRGRQRGAQRQGGLRDQQQPDGWQQARQHRQGARAPEQPRRPGACQCQRQCQRQQQEQGQADQGPQHWQEAVAEA
jgi:hypothetical protein